MAIDANLNRALAVAEFEPGSRYNDFDAGIGKLAARDPSARVAGRLVTRTAGRWAAARIPLDTFGGRIVVGGARWSFDQP